MHATELVSELELRIEESRRLAWVLTWATCAVARGVIWEVEARNATELTVYTAEAYEEAAPYGWSTG